MAAEFDSQSMDVLVRHDDDLKVEGRRIKSAEELTLLEARCQIQLFEHPEAVRGRQSVISKCQFKSHGTQEKSIGLEILICGEAFIYLPEGTRLHIRKHM